MASPNRTVPGHHGTRAEWIDQILADGFAPSSGAQEWFGHGIYFFEDAPSLGREWAEMVHTEHAAGVIEAEISLRHCLDLLAGEDADAVQPFYDKYFTVAGRTIKEFKQAQTDAYGDFDCAVINWACQSLAEEGRRIDVVRGDAKTGRPLFMESRRWCDLRRKGRLQSRNYTRAHIQLAVRNQCAILSVRRYLDSPTGVRDYGDN